ncbi:MAG: hypothetical protein WC365_04070 [Candidatus Babeliales bacterium]|jgi:hypothetical protein
MKQYKITRYSTLCIALMSCNPLCAKNGYAPSNEIGTSMVAKIRQELKEPLLTLLSTTEYASPQELERRITQVDEALTTFKAGLGIPTPQTTSPVGIESPSQPVDTATPTPAPGIAPTAAPIATAPQATPVAVPPPPATPQETPVIPTPIAPTPEPITVPQPEPIQIPTPEPIIVPTPPTQEAPAKPITIVPAAPITPEANVPTPEPVIEAPMPEVTVPTPPAEIAPAPAVVTPVVPQPPANTIPEA